MKIELEFVVYVQHVGRLGVIFHSITHAVFMYSWCRAHVEFQLNDYPDFAILVHSGSVCWSTDHIKR